MSSNIYYLTNRIIKPNRADPRNGLFASPKLGAKAGPAPAEKQSNGHNRDDDKNGLGYEVKQSRFIRT